MKVVRVSSLGREEAATDVALVPDSISLSADTRSRPVQSSDVKSPERPGTGRPAPIIVSTPSTSSRVKIEPKAMLGNSFTLLYLCMVTIQFCIHSVNTLNYCFVHSKFLWRSKHKSESVWKKPYSVNVAKCFSSLSLFSIAFMQYSFCLIHRCYMGDL